jgi:hypothetical protein
MVMQYGICIPYRVSPFRLKNFFAYKRNKANLDPFHLCFTISLQNFTPLFSLLFASFRFKFFASLHFGNFCFEVKQSEAKVKSIFSLFSFFSLFFTFFRFFCFKFFASLRFSDFCFEAKQSEAKFKSMFSLFSLFFTFFTFFHFFSIFFA